jgi:hypothetical protein
VFHNDFQRKLHLTDCQQSNWLPFPPYAGEDDTPTKEAETSTAQGKLEVVDVVLISPDSALPSPEAAPLSSSGKRAASADNSETLPPLAPPKRPYHSVGDFQLYLI